MGITTDLSHHFIEAVDQAAIASAAWRGKGDKNAADDAAVEAMRRTFDKVPFDGRVAIGEGERDDAPMLFIGEELGSMVGRVGAPKIDIAVDPLECTNNCADNQPNSIAVLAAAPRGTLLHAPDCYMDKIAAGPLLADHLSLEGGASYNIEQNRRCTCLTAKLKTFESSLWTEKGTHPCSKKFGKQEPNFTCSETAMSREQYGRQRMTARLTC